MKKWIAIVFMTSSSALADGLMLVSAQPVVENGQITHWICAYKPVVLPIGGVGLGAELSQAMQQMPPKVVVLDYPCPSRM